MDPFTNFEGASEVCAVHGGQEVRLIRQYGPEDDALSLYSAMPSTTGADSLMHRSIPTDVGLAIEDLSMYDPVPHNGHGHDHNGDDEYEDLHQPLGLNVEHACR